MPLSVLPLPVLLLLHALVPQSTDAKPAEDAKKEEKPKWDVNAPGGPSRERAIDTKSGTWMNLDVSPDGKELVFDLLGDIYVMPIAGGEAKAVASGVAWQMQPRWSPDGKRIAFTSDAGGGDNLWVMDRDGANARAVTKETFRLLSAPAWSPDGEYLVGRKHFTSRRSIGAGELWLSHVATGGDGLQLTEKRNEQKDLGEPAFSPDGRYVYYSHDSTPGDTFEYNKDPNAQIYAVDRLERETGDIVSVVTGPGGACRPTPSPDGKSLAFVRRVRYRTTLFVMDLASGAARPVWDGLERDMQETWAIHGVYPAMAWTSDGKELVLWARGKLWRVAVNDTDAKGGAPREIPFHVKDQRTVFDAVHFPVEVAPESFDVKLLRWVRVAPAGDLVVYQALGRRWARPLPDGAPRRLTKSENVFEFFPALSPDGKWVAFVERWNAYVAPFVATGREVSIGPKSTAFPVAKVSRDAGENLQFSGDSKRLHWSLGPELYKRDLADAFLFLSGAPPPRPGEPELEPLEPPATGRKSAFRAPFAKPSGALALVGAKLVTMKGDEVIADGAIVVDGNRITAVGPRASVAIPSQARVFDVSGTTIVPGLIDVHAHGAQASDGITPWSNWIHAANLAFGVTTIHDPSNDTNEIHAVGELAKAGFVLSPRTFSTGTILYGAMGAFAAPIDSLDEARSHLRRLQAVGAISVKSYNQPRRDQRQQVLAAARELGLHVVPEGGSLFQHNMSMVVDGHTGIEHSLPVEHVYQDVLQLWGPSGVGYTPTLVVGYGGPWGEEYWYQHEDVWANERLQRFVPRFVLDPRSRRRPKYPDEEFNTLRSSGICKALVDAGGSVQLGAHGQLAGLAAHWELEMFVQGGMSAHEALRCGTLSGARYVGLDKDLGSLEPGKLADLFVCEGDALADVARTRDVRYTMLNGRLYDASTLAPVDGRGGTAPKFFWTDMQHGLPAQANTAECAACR